MMSDYISLVEAFTFQVRDNPDSTMIIREKNGTEIEQETFRQFARRVYSLMKDLEQKDILPGDHVVCYTKNSETLLLYYLACGLSRILVLPITDAFSPAMIRKLILQCKVKGIITDLDKESHFTSQKIEILRGLPLDQVKNSLDQNILAELQEHLSRIDIAQPFLLQPTSGSTGAPKLVIRSHKSLARYTHFIANQIRSSVDLKQATLLLTGELNYTISINISGVSLSLGIPLILPEKTNMDFKIESLTHLQPTIVVCVPRVLNSIYKQAAAANSTSPNVFENLISPKTKIFYSGGGQLDEKVLGDLESLGKTIITVFGSSESGLIAISPLSNRKLGFAGQLVSDINVKQAPDGELLIKSPGMMLGYYGLDQQEMQNHFDSEGYFKSGDIVEIDPQNFIRVLSRKRDVYSTFSGYPIYPERIEQKLELIPSVDQVILLGDAKPFNIALIILKDSETRPLDDFIEELHTIFVLSPEKARETYQYFMNEIVAINKTLEPLEQITRFAISCSFFNGRHYKVLRQGKLRRQRRQFFTAFASEINFLYSDKFNHSIFQDMAKLKLDQHKI